MNFNNYKIKKIEKMNYLLFLLIREIKHTYLQIRTRKALRYLQ